VQPVARLGVASTRWDMAHRGAVLPVVRLGMASTRWDMARPGLVVRATVCREVILAPVASQLPLLVLLDISQEPRQLIRHYPGAKSHRPRVLVACPRVS